MDVFKQFARLNKKGKNKLWKRIKAECELYPMQLQLVPMDIDIPEGVIAPKEIWRSRGFVVQVYEIEGNPDWERLSINRNAFSSDFSRFLDGISWERIQELKAECGRASLEAVEIYPGDEDIVNVANLRHIWVRKSGSFIREYKIGWTSAEFAVSGSVTDAKDTAPDPVSDEQLDTQSQPATHVG